MKIEWNESRGRASFWLGDAECIADEDENHRYLFALSRAARRSLPASLAYPKLGMRPANDNAQRGAA